MGKRSRDVSFSPSGDEAASELTRASTEPEDLHTAKLIAYDFPPPPADKHMMQCSLPPHSGSLGFASLRHFEVHYAKEHTNRCVECGRNLPSLHFLNLHIDESHNPLREALAAKGEKTYGCFVPDCEKKCSTPQKRRMHLIDKHNFPKDYNFRIVNNGIDNANTLLQEGRRRRISVTNDQSSPYRQQVTSISKPTNKGRPGVVLEGSIAIRDEATTAKSDKQKDGLESALGSDMALSSVSSNVDDLERSFAELQFVPRSVASKRWKTQT